MSKIHKITKQKVKKKSFDSNCLFLKEIHPSEPITFRSFMEIMLDHQERSLANICCWSALVFKQRNTWWSNSSEWADISFEGNGRKSNMNLFAIREETKIFGLSFWVYHHGIFAVTYFVWSLTLKSEIKLCRSKSLSSWRKCFEIMQTFWSFRHE